MKNILDMIHTHTHIHTYTYMYIVKYKDELFAQSQWRVTGAWRETGSSGNKEVTSIKEWVVIHMKQFREVKKGKY